MLINPRKKLFARVIIASTIAVVIFVSCFSLWCDGYLKTIKEIPNTLSLPEWSEGSHPLSSSFISSSSTSTLTKSPHSLPPQLKHLNFLKLEPERLSRLFWSSLEEEDRPWFMKGGSLRPSPENEVFSRLPIWPEEGESSNDDRIVNQLMYLPPQYDPQSSDLKKIFIHNGGGGWSHEELPRGRTRFLKDSCPVDRCTLTDESKDFDSSDIVLYKDHFQNDGGIRNPDQIWVIFLLEAPTTMNYRTLRDQFNWTATYRSDSTIVTPYEKYFILPQDESDFLHKQMDPSTNPSPSFVSPPSPMYSSPSLMNFTSGDGGYIPSSASSSPPLSPTTLLPTFQEKGAKVAWFVSNCAAANPRMEYARNLKSFITVDIFGDCGPKSCPRSKGKECMQLLNSQYKFYLAFENSNCQDYITEKFYVNGLNNDVIPIVMGAPPDAYRSKAPANSYIHVEDFKDPKQLAQFLLLVAQDESLFNSYLRWKEAKGEFINTFFWCRLCAMAHAPRPGVEKGRFNYDNLSTWWAGAGTCRNQGWKRNLFLTGNEDDEEDTDQMDNQVISDNHSE